MKTLHEGIRETLNMLNEKWEGNPEIEKTGEWADKTIEELEAAKAKIEKKEDHSPDDTKKLKQINFAIRAKRNWSAKGAKQ